MIKDTNESIVIKLLPPMSFQKIIPLILVLFFSTELFSQQQNKLSIKQLADSIQSIVNSDHVPGLMVGITNKDSAIFSGGFGYADVKTNRPVNGSTLFRLGSITKMFISLSILKLVQEGKLHLDDELKKLAPEVPFQNKWEDSHPVRIVNLLEHTAGFDDMKLNRMCSNEKKEYSGKEMMLLQQPSMISRWKPGERHSYSNPGFVILGYIIEKISGKSYGDYIAENMLLPLGMGHTNFNHFSKLPEDTKQYVVHSGKIIEVPSITILMGPAGSLWSCSDDMLKFIRLFLADGKPIFPGSVIHEMETMRSSLAAKAGLKNGYALANAGMFLFDKSAAWRGHSGLMGTCFSFFSYNKQLGVGFVMSSNGNQQNQRIEKLIADYLEQSSAVKNLDTLSTDLKAIAPFMGHYEFENPRNEIAGFKDKLMNSVKVYAEDNSIFVKPLLGNGGPMKLVQTAAFQFAHEGANAATVIFTKNEEGKNVMVIDGAYYEQKGAFALKSKIWVAITAIFFALSACVAGIFSFIAFFIIRLKKEELLTRTLPLSAVLLLVFAVFNLLQVQSESYLLSELRNIDTRSLSIFSGTLLFGLFAIWHLVIVIRKFSQFKNKFFAYYWLGVSLSVFYIAFVLFQNGWIGLRTWAM